MTLMLVNGGREKFIYHSSFAVGVQNVRDVYLFSNIR